MTYTQDELRKQAEKVTGIKKGRDEFNTTFTQESDRLIVMMGQVGATKVLHNEYNITRKKSTTQYRTDQLRQLMEHFSEKELMDIGVYTPPTVKLEFPDIETAERAMKILSKADPTIKYKKLDPSKEKYDGTALNELSKFGNTEDAPIRDIIENAKHEPIYTLEIKEKK